MASGTPVPPRHCTAKARRRAGGRVRSGEVPETAGMEQSRTAGLETRCPQEEEAAALGSGGGTAQPHLD